MNYNAKFDFTKLGISPSPKHQPSLTRLINPHLGVLDSVSRKDQGSKQTNEDIRDPTCARSTWPSFRTTDYMASKCFKAFCLPSPNQGQGYQNLGIQQGESDETISFFHVSRKDQCVAKPEPYEVTC